MVVVELPAVTVIVGLIIKLPYKFLPAAARLPANPVKSKLFIENCGETISVPAETLNEMAFASVGEPALIILVPVDPA
jgi:hypothetical protein